MHLRPCSPKRRAIDPIGCLIETAMTIEIGNKKGEKRTEVISGTENVPKIEIV